MRGIKGDDMRLADKTALITGGASGFYRAIAETFAREGAEVTIVDLNGDGAEAVAAKIGGRAIQGDVTKAADIAAAVDAAQGADNGSISW